jgi:D-alanine-D-alanine ligase
MTRVLLLGGGPDAERAVSLASAAAIATALRARFEVQVCTIDRIEAAALRELHGEVVFPALHGQFGEGGPLQDLLEADGRPYVGCGPSAARACMDKMGCKLAAAGLGVRTAPAFVFDPRDAASPIDPPLVLKPTHDGSSVGLHVCPDRAAWARAADAARRDIDAHPYRSYLVEQYIPGTELTVAMLSQNGRLEALPLVQIRPASGVYDYEAKYTRSDTVYTVGPALGEGVSERISAEALRVAEHLGVRDLARVDFLLDNEGRYWFLEINTMPGFTSTSLVPKAAAAAGFSFEALCAHLVGLAWSRRAEGA